MQQIQSIQRDLLVLNEELGANKSVKGKFFNVQVQDGSETQKQDFLKKSMDH